MNQEEIDAVHPRPLSTLSKRDQRRVAHEAISVALNQVRAAGGEPDEWERYQIGSAIADFAFWKFYVASFNSCLLAALPADHRSYQESAEVELPTFEQLELAFRALPIGADE